MTKDFRASQVSTTKIIASGSTGTGASILVYPITADDTGTPNSGLINPAAFGTENIGTDVFLYVSGAVGSTNVADSHGTSVFGGDLVVSGNFKVIGTTSISGAGASVTVKSEGTTLTSNLSSIDFVGPGVSASVAGNNVTVTISGSSNSGGAGEVSASYLVLSTTSSLANERVFTPGTSLSMSDGGPGGNLTLSYVGEAPELSASYLVLGFTSSLANERVLTVGTGLSSSDGGSGSDFHISAPFVSASYITVNSETTLPNERTLVFNGVLSSSDGGAGSNLTVSYVGEKPELSASYVVLGITSSLANERVLTSGPGINITDYGANNNVVISASILAGPGITINTNASGAMEITGSTQSIVYADVSASFLTLNATSSLANERVFALGTGLSSSDGGAGGNYTLNVLDSVFATITGSVFTGRVYAAGGLTGSLQQVAPGIPYIQVTGNLSITTQSNGSLLLSASGGSAAGGSGNVSGSAPTTDFAIPTWSGSLGTNLNNSLVRISNSLISSLSASTITSTGSLTITADSVLSGQASSLGIFGGTVVSGAAGAGGPLTLSGGAAGTTGNGGIAIFAGGPGGTTSGAGATIFISGGNALKSGAGGAVIIAGGRPSGSANAGSVTIQGGNVIGTASTGSGGDITIICGTSISSSTAPGISLTAGSLATTTAGGVAGTVSMKAGNASISPGINGNTSTAGSLIFNAGWSTGGSGALLFLSGGRPGTGGGDITLQAGTAGDGVNGSLIGGNLNLIAGIATGAGQGGIVTITAGNGPTNLPGSVNITGGAVTANQAATAGAINITGGATAGTGGGGAGLGGVITITGGVGPGGGGAVTIKGGAGQTGGGTGTNGGNVIITGGAANSNSTARDGGSVVVTAGGGDAGGNGGSITLTAGAVGFGAGTQAMNGGNITFAATNSKNGGTAGYILITAGNGSSGSSGVSAGGGITITPGIGYAIGGNLTLLGGPGQAVGFNGSLPGSVFAIGGDASQVAQSGMVSGGTLILSGGKPGVGAPGGQVLFAGGPGGTTSGSGGFGIIRGGHATTLGSGGKLFISGGNAAGGSFNGGDVNIIGGAATGTGSYGVVNIGTINGGTVITERTNTPISTSNQTLITGSFSRISTASGSISAVNLPLPASSAGNSIRLTKISTDNFTFTLKCASGSINNIVGTTGIALGDVVYQSGSAGGWTATCDGTNWWVSNTLGTEDNFSYTKIVSGSTVTIPLNQQMLYDGDLIIEGTLIVDGAIVQNNDSMFALALVVSGGKVDISASAPPTAGQVLVATNSTTAVWTTLISGADSAAQYLVLSTTASLANERTFVTGTGLSSSDGGASGNFTIGIDNTVVATLSGSRFTGRVYASGGLTGSLQEVSPGVSYIVAGPYITVVTNSNGSIEISGSGIASALNTNNGSSAVYVSASAPPTVGQMLVATDSTTAAWQFMSASSVRQSIPAVITTVSQSLIIGALNRIDTSGGTIDPVLLPHPSSSTGQTIELIALAGTNHFHVYSPSGNINAALGTDRLTINPATWDQFVFKCDGTNWYVAHMAAPA